MLALSTTGHPLPDALSKPRISLTGTIDDDAVSSFLDQLDPAMDAGGDIAVEVTTLGGDPDFARRIIWEIECARARMPGRLLFLGKSIVYSAGVTLMSAFPRRDRFVTADTMLMIHGRQLEQTITLSGPIRNSLTQLAALQSQLEIGVDLEEQDFRRLIEDTDLDFDDLCARARTNWYLSAAEALDRRLIGGVLAPPLPHAAKRPDRPDNDADMASPIAATGSNPDR